MNDHADTKTLQTLYKDIFGLYIDLDDILPPNIGVFFYITICILVISCFVSVSEFYINNFISCFLCSVSSIILIITLRSRYRNWKREKYFHDTAMRRIADHLENTRFIQMALESTFLNKDNSKDNKMTWIKVKDLEFGQSYALDMSAYSFMYEKKYEDEDHGVYYGTTICEKLHDYENSIEVMGTIKQILQQIREGI